MTLRVSAIAVGVLLASCGNGEASVDPLASVVTIEASGCRPTPTRAVGTVVGDGLVVTVAHAVAGETDIFVRSADGRAHRGVVAAIDTRLDAAVLRVDGLESDAVASRPYEDGDDITFVVVREGAVSRVPVDVRRRVTIRTSDIYRRGEHLRPGLEVAAVVRAGDSGGGLVGTDGDLVGMVWSASRRVEDRAWALTSEAIAPVIAAAASGQVSPAVTCSR